MTGLTPAYRIKLISTKQESGGEWEEGMRSGKTTTSNGKKKKRVQQKEGAEDSCFAGYWGRKWAHGEETGLASGVAKWAPEQCLVSYKMDLTALEFDTRHSQQEVFGDVPQGDTSWVPKE